jgi:hypothetical protein
MENLSVPISQNSINLIKKQPKRKPKLISKILEIGVVISAIAVVIILALLAINPGKKGSEARNLQRQADISYILTLVSQYSRTSKGIPNEINITDDVVLSGNEICKIGPYDCKDYTDLNFLNYSSNQDNINIPTDPLYLSINGTGYYINQDGQGSITVSAPYAERNKEISFTKYLY